MTYAKIMVPKTWETMVTMRLLALFKEGFSSPYPTVVKAAAAHQTERSKSPIHRCQILCGSLFGLTHSPGGPKENACQSMRNCAHNNKGLEKL